MPKNVLIISHVFPPTPGIGGRRWAKFAKYLSRKGHNVFVLASENITNSSSEWTKDVEGLSVKYLPYNYPKVLALSPPGFLNKLKYFLSLFFLKLIYGGNYFDRSIFWKRQIQREIADYIINKNIDCVIVTSAPFRLSDYVTQMKSKFPQIQFIADFRDLWTEDTEITFFSKISQKRKKAEKQWEKETINNADIVLTPLDNLTRYFSSLTNVKKFITLPNGFDSEDFKDLEVKDQVDDDKIRIVYAGTLYLNLNYILNPFFKALSKIKNENPVLFSKIQIEFIGNFPSEYLILVKENGVEDCIKILPKIPLKEVFYKIKTAHYCMLILNDIYNFSLSTKFYEYLSQKKKILVVSNKGETADFVESNRLGHWINPANAYQDLLKVLDLALKKEHLEWKSELEISKYSVESLTVELEKILNGDISEFKLQ